MSILPDLDALSFDAVIPSALLLNENIEPNAIKLYAFVRGLTKAHGYCYATNEYLAACMRCDKSTIQRLLSSLKAEKFIEIQTDKNGIHWQRKIFVGVNFKNCLRSLKNEAPPPQNQGPPTLKMPPIYKECIQSEILDGEKKEAAPLPPAPLFSEGKIKMHLEKKEALEKEFGVEKVRETIESLKDYSEVNPVAFKKYACHAAVIRTWIKRDAKSGKSSSMGSSLDRNREWARVVASKYPGKSIEAGNESLMFLAGNYPIYISYKDLGFKDQVISRLRKMGLSAEGI